MSTDLDNTAQAEAATQVANTPAQAESTANPATTPPLNGSAQVRNKTKPTTNPAEPTANVPENAAPARAVQIHCSLPDRTSVRTVAASLPPADGGAPKEFHVQDFDPDDAEARAAFCDRVVATAPADAAPVIVAQIDADLGAAIAKADAGETIGRADTVAERVVDMLEAFITPIHTADGEPYVIMELPAAKNGGGRSECMPVRGRAFQTAVRGHYFAQTRRAVKAEAMSEVVETVAAMACFEGEEAEVFVRTARAEIDGRSSIVIDIADETGRAIVVDGDGWSIVPDSPVAFVRPQGQLPLTEPAPPEEADLEPFLDLMHLAPESRSLFAAFLCTSLFPEGPFAGMYLNGQHGSAKTYKSKQAKALIDPNAAPVRRPPRNEDDLVIAAKNSHLLAYDNCGTLKPWLSDALCRILTGAASGVRKLYTDSEEVLTSFQNPVILNGIGDFVRAPDLGSRVLPVTAESIKSEDLIPEAELDAKVAAARPAALTALLNGMSAALKTEEEGAPPPAGLPRLADFAARATAAETALGFESGAVLRNYWTAVGAIEDDLLDGYPDVRALIEFLQTQFGVVELENEKFVADGQPPKPVEYVAQPAKLLAKVNAAVDHRDRTGTGWPTNAAALTRRLQEVAPILERLGIEMTRERGKYRRTRFTKIEAAVPQA
ncbi:hypothetical protein [Alienimonas sp. DA493]|uniref:hypothetical protein n=1 Tax=Alienimonas sp. DA493 TaxID=3373605 RepID=UPI0037543414